MFIATIAFLIAGFVKGVIGLGLPTVAIGLLGLVMPPAEAAALLVVPSLVTNVWQLAAGPSFTALLRRSGQCCWASVPAHGRRRLRERACWLLANWAMQPECRRGIAGQRVSWTYQNACPGSGADRNPLLIPGRSHHGRCHGGYEFRIPAVPWLQAMKLRRDDLTGSACRSDFDHCDGGRSVEGGASTGPWPRSSRSPDPGTRNGARRAGAPTR